MIKCLLEWLKRKAPQESEAQRIESILRGLDSADTTERQAARRTFTLIIYNTQLDYSAEFVISLLNATAKRTNLKNPEWVLSYVNYLGQPHAEVLINADVRKAALACIHQLRERLEPDYLANTLLHSLETPPSNDLLRPAASGNPSQAELLLRSHPADQSSENETQPL